MAEPRVARGPRGVSDGPLTGAFLLSSKPVRSLGEYVAQGGGQGLEQARHLGAEQTIAELALSQLGGRGGAGFPTARKWQSIRDSAASARASVTHDPRDVTVETFAAANAAEGEPGTFKDRAVIRANPYQVIEGLLIAAESVGATYAWVGIKEDFVVERKLVEDAIAEMQAAGWFGDVEIGVKLLPHDYLSGEESAFVEASQGGGAYPRHIPVYIHGYDARPQLGWQATPGDRLHERVANPTLVNNVETLATVPHILAHGAEWHRSLGAPDSPGHVVVTLTGDVRHAGVAEVALGTTTLREVIEQIGGGTERPVKMVLSGVANEVITADELDKPLSHAGLNKRLGAAGFIVYDDSTCAAEVADAVTAFLAEASCGQCNGCKVNLGGQHIDPELPKGLSDKLHDVAENRGVEADFPRIGKFLRQLKDGNRCYLPVEAQNMVSSLIEQFPDDFADHLELERVPHPHRGLRVNMLAAIENGQAVQYEHGPAAAQPVSIRGRGVGATL